MSSAAPPVSPTGQSDAGIPHAGPWPLFGFGLVALGLIWLPLAVLQQIDALLAFMTLPKLGRDVALLLVLLATLAGLLATIGTVGAWLVRRLGAGQSASNVLAWSLVGLPIASVSAWQFVYGVKHWIELAIGNQRLATGPLLKVALVVALVMAMVALWRRIGTGRLLRAVVVPLLGLLPLALIATALALAFLVWEPPVVHRSSSGSLSTRPAALDAAPDIFLISIDSLAAGDAAICGDGPTPMPHLRQLASRSACFSRYYASSNFTTPTTSTMETGTLPWNHWAVQIGARIAAPLRDESMANILQATGYTTHSISANLLASPRHHGTYRGYDTVDIAPSTSLRTTLREALTRFPDSSIPIFIYSVFSFLWTADIYLHGDRNPYDPEQVYQSVTALIKQAGRERPVFVWMHTMPPHAPYLPPKTTKYRLLPAGELDYWREFLADNLSYGAAQQALVDKHRLRYRESIMAADESLGAFLDTLERLGRLDSAIVIVTADHGESFERGYLGHAGNLLHDALIRIPLIVKLPGQKSGRVVDIPVSQADLVPSVLDLARAKPLPRAEGRSLGAVLAGQPLASKPVFSMSLERESRFKPIRGGHVAVIEGHFKLVHDLERDRSELYDLATDPLERHDLVSSQPKIVNRLRDQIRMRIATAESVRRAWFGR